MSDIEVMTVREKGIYDYLLGVDNAFFLSEDHSDIYALSPEHLGPGLIRIPGEYTNMNDLDVDRHVAKAVETDAWIFIPLSEVLTE